MKFVKADKKIIVQFRRSASASGQQSLRLLTGDLSLDTTVWLPSLRPLALPPQLQTAVAASVY